MISVIGGAYTSYPSQYEKLATTAKKFGMPLTIIGEGRSYPSIPTAIDEAVAAVNNAADYVVITDTYDTLVCRWDADEVIASIDAEPSGLLISTEASCWPPGTWCSAYKNGRYINGGQMCGRREAVAEVLRKIRDYEPVAGGSTQEALHVLYASGYPMGLDFCEIFQSMSGDGSKPVVWSGERVINEQFFSLPMLMHFNGRTPNADVWYERIMACPIATSTNATA
jgi:hypothetical protein